MTTGRINQIARCGADPGARARRSGRGSRGPNTPRGGKECVSGRGARGARSRRRPWRTRGDADDHPIAPTKPLSAGPHAGVPAGPPGRAGAGCGIRPSGGGAGPHGRRRRTAVPAGRLPPGISVAGVASGHPSTDPGGAGDQAAPGLQRSRHSAARIDAPRASPPGAPLPTSAPRATRTPQRTIALSGEESVGREPGKEERGSPDGHSPARRQATPNGGETGPVVHSSIPLPDKGSNKHGRCVGRRDPSTPAEVSLLHILSDICWEGQTGTIVQGSFFCWQGPVLIWVWPVHGFFSHTNWASV